MARNYRPARMAAMLVEWGDVIVTGPSVQPTRQVGTVVAVHTEEGWRHITIRKPNGERETMRPVAEERPVWVNVPGGSA